MAIYNLGNVGEPRKSAIGGLSEALSTGINDYATLQLAKQKNAIEMAKFNQDTEEKDRKHALKIMEDYSMYMAGKDQTEQELFKQTDAYKQMQKVIKRIFPEYIDDKGDIIIIPKQDIYETHFKKKEHELMQVVAGGGKLDDTQERTLDFIRSNDINIVSQAVANAEADYGWYETTDPSLSEPEVSAAQSRLIQKHIGFLSRGRRGNIMGGNEDDPLNLKRQR